MLKKNILLYLLSNFMLVVSATCSGALYETRGFEESINTYPSGQIYDNQGSSSQEQSRREKNAEILQELPFDKNILSRVYASEDIEYFYKFYVDESSGKLKRGVSAKKFFISTKDPNNSAFDKVCAILCRGRIVDRSEVLGHGIKLISVMCDALDVDLQKNKIGDSDLNVLYKKIDNNCARLTSVHGDAIELRLQRLLVNINSKLRFLKNIQQKGF